MKLIDQYKGLKKEVYILFIGRIVTRFGSMVWSMLTLILSQKLGYSAADISVFMLVFGVVSMITNLLGGKLADKFSKKNCIVYFDILSIVLYSICAIIPLSNMTVVFIVIAASAQWAEHPAYSALIADITPSEDRERAYALQYLGINIGLMASPTLAGFLFKNYLPVLFIICAVSIGISTVLIFFKVQDTKPIIEADKALQKRRDGDSLWTVLKSNKILLLYAFAMGLYTTGYEQYNYLMPLDLGRIYGEDGAVLFGTVTSTNCLIVVIFSPIVLNLFSRTKPSKKILVADFLILIGFGVFLKFINYIPAYYIAIILFTFGEIFAYMSDAPFLAANSPASHRARVNSFSTTVGNAMSSVILLFVGKLYDVKGYASAWLFVMGIMVLAIIAILGLMRMEKPRPSGL